MSKQEIIITLDITDAEAVSFLYMLRRIFTGKYSALPPHVTLRGPYATMPSKKTRENVKEAARQLGDVRIADAGIFENNGTYVVYMNVYKQKIKDLTWKRDYPKKEYDSKPHITIYDGKDPNKARAIYTYLLFKSIEFNVRMTYSINRINSKQYNLQYSKPTNRKLVALLREARRINRSFAE